jgi:hypothetical protein
MRACPALRTGVLAACSVIRRNGVIETNVEAPIEMDPFDADIEAVTACMLTPAVIDLMLRVASAWRNIPWVVEMVMSSAVLILKGSPDRI